MKRLALALALAALALPALARGGTSFGVTEDAAKYSSDGGAAVFARLHDLGMAENAISVQWDPERPTTILEKQLLDRLVPNASRSGIRLVFTVYFTRPNAVATTPGGAARYADFLRLLARTYPSVKDYIVGNEPNYGVFWQPQYDRTGRPLAGAGYEALLAASYDALKGVDPQIQVTGMGLSPRGNDRPFSRSPSTSPVLFVRDVGQAYRRSGRTRPLMDAFAYHPYPPSSVATPATTTGWPDAGVADLARVKQAVWDAFHGTGQRTFEDGLGLRITEIGWQVAASGGAYHGAENVRVTDEDTQARIYAQLVRDLSCDPAVTDVLFFHLVDESDLRGFQSGLVRADGSPRPSYGAVRSAIAGGGCSGTPLAWHHTDAVVGAGVSFSPVDGAAPAVQATAQEGATYRAAIVRVDDGAASQDALRISLSGAGAVAGPLRAYGRAVPALLAPDAPGTYVEVVQVNALANPDRSSIFVSDRFTVAAPTAPVEDAAAPPAVKAPAATTPSIAPAPVTPVASEPVAASPPPPPTPASSVFAVEPTRAAKPKRAAAAPRRPAVRPHARPASSVSFQKRPELPTRKPGATKLDDDASAASSATRSSLVPGEPGRPMPLLFAALLVGAALASMLAVRLVIAGR